MLIDWLMLCLLLVCACVCPTANPAKRTPFQKTLTGERAPKVVLGRRVDAGQVVEALDADRLAVVVHEAGLAVCCLVVVVCCCFGLVCAVLRRNQD